MRFENKIILVTGAARGIGLATAKAFAAEGAILWLTDFDEKAGNAACEKLRNEGYKAQFRRLDITDEEAWTKLVREIDETHQRFDILVNCAGRTDFSPIRETSWASVVDALDVNFGGAYQGVRACMQLMGKRNSDEPWASIVNISSMAALNGVPFFNSYAASKAALSSFTKTAALEFAKLKLPIRVNAVLPGTIDTDMSAKVQNDMLRFGGTAEEMRALAIARHPIGRIGEVDDIVYAILYLADPRASFTTGQNLTVSGGREAT